MNRPLVSIIVPCYKVEQYLPVCIESVLGQTYDNWELILVDDGSPDRSGEICDQYAAKDKRINVIHKPNGGLSSARNAGLDMMNGEYVTFLDSDDFWHKDYLRVMMKHIDDEKADIVQCGFLRGIETVFPDIDRHEECKSYNNHTVFTQQATKIIMCGKVYKSCLFEGVRMPVGLINEDDWTTWKLYYNAKTIVVTNLSLYYYTQNPNSIMGIQKKKPDLRYFGAYRERIAFFKEIGEQDLVDVSRMQWCKSLLLLYSNQVLTEEERKEVKQLFDENWTAISKSEFVPCKLKLLFYGFYKMPVLSSFTSSFRRIGGGNLKISVIVPCYKVEQYLPVCIESVLGQTYDNWELILVNDGSPDRSGEICDKYAANDKRIKVIHKQNAGVAAARNSGIEIASGDYATYLDDDDFLHPDCLREMVRIAQGKNADIVQCGYVRGNANTFPSCHQKEVLREYDNHSVFAADVAKIIVWGKLCRTDILKDIRIPEGRYFEDDLVTWRWYYAASRIVVTSLPYYYYTCNAQSTMAQHHKKPNLSFIEAYEERIDFFRMTGELDMEDYSHRHLCKSLCLTYGNPFLTAEQKSLVWKKFNESWACIRHSSFIGQKYSILFTLFGVFPIFVTKLLKYIR